MSSTSGNDTYSSLSDVFVNRKSDEVLEIEILTADRGPLLQDGLCVGITKAALVKAFLLARKKFLEYLIQQKRNKTNAFSDGSKELEIATQIILLFDCEHVMACNWRKRYISSLTHEFVLDRDIKLSDGILQKERTLITSFQCSPLHRHTKSPTLWQHRLWIMTKLLALREEHAVNYGKSDNSLRSTILEELDVVCKSSQLHPRNYYAFSYMRQLHALVCQSWKSSSSHGMLIELAIAMVGPMLKWCLSNPSDISGWMYLFYLLNRDNDMLQASLLEERRLVMKRTIHFAVEIAAWEGESLWTFVNLMIARFGVDILPLADTTKPVLWNTPLASGARWKTTRLRVIETYKEMQDQAIS